MRLSSVVECKGAKSPHSESLLFCRAQPLLELGHALVVLEPSSMDGRPGRLHGFSRFQRGKIDGHEWVLCPVEKASGDFMVLCERV
jgi:hypothetical protein